MSSEPKVILKLRGRGERSFGRGETVLASRRGEAPPVSQPVLDVAVGDYVGVRYGCEFPTDAPPLPAPPERPLYGSEKRIAIPRLLNANVAFLLGAYMAEGHTNRSNWSVVITNSVPDVLQRVKAAVAAEFGIEAKVSFPRDRCSYVTVASKRFVEFLAMLGSGTHAYNKQVPQVVLGGTREQVLAFMQGAALDAYTTHQWGGKWAICLESHRAIDQIQDLMTKLGIVNAQIGKLNKQNGKTYYELYAAGPWGQEMARIVPFLEPQKAASARAYVERNYRTGATDRIPGMTGPELYALIPSGRSGRSGRGSGRQALRHLCDPRTSRPTRASVARAQTAGAAIPAWLKAVLETETRFAEVLGADHE